jgi:hypothetical protein
MTRLWSRQRNIREKKKRKKKQQQKKKNTKTKTLLSLVAIECLLFNPK